MIAASQEYAKKLMTPEAAAGLVQSGNRIFYGEFVLFPATLDDALARRKDELENVQIHCVCLSRIPKVVEVDPRREHFIVDDWHFSSISRRLYDQGSVSYIPFSYHQGPRVINKYLEYDVAYLVTGPMGPRGNFNFGLCNSLSSAVIHKAKTIVVEVNRNVPHCYGGNQEAIHISRVDYIVEGKHEPLAQIRPPAASDTEKKIAGHILKEIQDGACLQLGIGGLPNVIGEMIAASDLKELGVHTEMLVDSYVDLYNAGKITCAHKTFDRYKMVYTFAMGTDKLYEFLHRNPACASYPVNYTNDPRIIGMNNKVVAINNAIEVDLFSQVCSESSGTAHKSGTGGQLDFIMGAFFSRGGKGIIGLSATYKGKDGTRHSRIVPTLKPGAVVTVPRSIVQYVATEYGIAQLKGKSTWERAEALIAIAHPDFQEELIHQAEKMNIWCQRHRKDAS